MKDTVLIVKQPTHNLGRLLDNQHGISPWQTINWWQNGSIKPRFQRLGNRV